MPIYEYKCQECQNIFEQIRLIKEADTELECPFCHSLNVKRQISLCNASSGGQSITGGGGGCSGCSGGSCSTCGTR